MDGGADQNALAHLSGKLEDRMGNQGSGFFVQKLIFSAAGRDRKLAGADLIVQLVRIDTGGIDDTAGFKGVADSG